MSRRWRASRRHPRAPSAPGRASSARSPARKTCAATCSAFPRALTMSALPTTKTMRNGSPQGLRSGGSIRTSNSSTCCSPLPKSAWLSSWKAGRISPPNCKSLSWPKIPRRIKRRSNCPPTMRIPLMAKSPLHWCTSITASPMITSNSSAWEFPSREPSSSRDTARPGGGSSQRSPQNTAPSAA